MPKFGESITFWWRRRLVRLSRELNDEQHDSAMHQWIVCRQVLGRHLSLLYRLAAKKNIIRLASI